MSQLWAIAEQLTRSSEPWVAYGAEADLDPSASATANAYTRMREHPLVGQLISSLDVWPTSPLGKAYDPKNAIWQLSVLADFGLRRDDSRIEGIAERLLAAQADTGAFLHGGFDHTKSWHQRAYICIDHVQTYALARFGYLGDPRLDRAYQHIVTWQRLDGGWHPNEKALPGGDRKDEPSCPFGTVNILRAVVAHPDLLDGPVARRAADHLLTAWERRAEP